jgi:hypothetical protein
MTKAELKHRTKQFGHRCLDVVDALPKQISAITAIMAASRKTAKS